MVSDRHGRACRADNDRRRRPTDGFRLADAGRFAQIVEDTLALLPDAFLDALADVAVRIEDVPPVQPDTVEVPLTGFHPKAGGERGVLVVYRRPVEARALSRLELNDVLRTAVLREVASVLGLDEPDEDWE